MQLSLVMLEIQESKWTAYSKMRSLVSDSQQSLSRVRTQICPCLFSKSDQCYNRLSSHF